MTSQDLLAPMPCVILLSGWSMSGKDTVGEILCEQYGFKRFAFADSLKQLCSLVLDLPINSFDTQEQKATIINGTSGLTRREFCIQFAKWLLVTTQDQSRFARSIGKGVSTAIHAGRSCVITDWRLPIEFETIQKELELLAIPIKLVRVRIKRSDQLESPVNTGITEHALDTASFDSTIINPGTSLEELAIAVEFLVKQI